MHECRNGDGTGGVAEPNVKVVGYRLWSADDHLLTTV